MKKIIAVVGATGNLGGKIIDALLSRGAEVRAIVRLETDTNKIKSLLDKGVQVYQVNTTHKNEIATHLKGVDCVVSALSGLREVIIDAQKNSVRCCY